ncbi:MAG: hypothetical protein A3H91_07945 [Gammaproteobacteria bacterium RIFCSPLOWO2_02_FULL_61_13]|nr:MAG: hypothetical protein A3H91_07945 [Gammaproteobacteria bacterium RIFCSPLOWO2_02_FULL_61_13]
MQMQHHLLEQCVDALKALRARMHEEPDVGVTAELDEVIHRLEQCLENVNEDVMVDAELQARGLEVLAKCLNAATNLAEIVHRFFGPQ